MLCVFVTCMTTGCTRPAHVSKLLQGITTLKLCSFSLPPSFPQEHVAKKDSTNSSELWYSTVSHDVKHEISVVDSNSKTEYALISVPEKANVTSTEEHSEYDDVLVT